MTLQDRRGKQSTFFKGLAVVCILLAALLIVNYFVHPLFQPASQRQATSPGRIPVHGKDVFLLGYNYPWYHYSYDFSAGSDTIHSNYSTIAQQFADMAKNGTHVTRWFIFNDFSQTPLFDTQDHIIDLPPAFFQAFDDAINIASANHIYLVLDFMDGGTLLKSSRENAQLYASIFTDPSTRQQFFEHIIKPVLTRYGRSASILAWSPLNEPDYETAGIKPDASSLTIPYQNMRDFMQQFTSSVHTYTQQLATIENGPLAFTHFWTGLGFDFYSPHYYDWMTAYWPTSDPVVNSVDHFHLDKPVVLGELPSASSKYSVTQLLDALYKNGYAGALFWSRNAHDDFSDYENTGAQLYAWEKTHRAAVTP